MHCRYALSPCLGYLHICDSIVYRGHNEDNMYDGLMALNVWSEPGAPGRRGFSRRGAGEDAICKALTRDGLGGVDAINQCRNGGHQLWFVTLR